MPTGLCKYLLIALVIASCVCLTTPGFARGGGRSGGFGGGSRSFGGGSSWGGGRSSAPAASSGWGSSARTSAPSASSSHPGFGSGTSGFGSSGRANSSRPQSAADRALYQKAQANGTAFRDRTSAVNNFKTRYGSQYTSRFATEPSVRPSYIPQTYTYGGRHYTIIYNHSYGGYGYYDPSGAWMMYDMMADTVMMNQMMSMNGYYYGGYGSPYYRPHYYYSGPSTWFWALFWVLLIILDHLPSDSLVALARGHHDGDRV